LKKKKGKNIDEFIAVFLALFPQPKPWVPKSHLQAEHNQYLPSPVPVRVRMRKLFEKGKVDFDAKNRRYMLAKE
jgi:hypothetical protein